MGARTVLTLPCVVTPSWRPVQTPDLEPLFGEPRRLSAFRAARDTYWDIYSSGSLAPCTVFLALSLLQRCYLQAVDEEEGGGGERVDDSDIPVATLWLAVKVMEGQDCALLGYGSVVCWEWNKFSAHHITPPGLLRAERETLRRLEVDVMTPTTFDLYICCLRLSQLRQQQKEEALERGMELLILIEGRAETLSYEEQEVVAGMCMVYGVPLPLELRDRISIERLTRVTQFVDSFEV